jgi:hypothetical protein
MYWEGIHKGACFELKNFFNLTEKDLEDLQWVIIENQQKRRIQENKWF